MKKYKNKFKLILTSLMFLYTLIMTILGIITMKPIGIMGWVLSGLWVVSIIGLYLIPTEKPKDNTDKAKNNTDV